MEIVFNKFVKTRAFLKYDSVQLVTLILAILILNLRVGDATYDIDDATLYRISFNEFGVKTNLNNGFYENKPGEIKLHQFSSKVLVDPTSGQDPKTVEIPDHSDMTVKKPDVPESEDELFDKITMQSQHGEKYICTIPRTDNLDKAGGIGKDGYQGQTALALLEPLFVSQSCAYRLEHYWTYELCHGRFLRQYHEERDGKAIKLDEYFLGKYDQETYQAQIQAVKDQIKSGKVKKPQKKRVETMNMPYLEVKMTSGTLCDLNGLPRMTRIQYVCYPSGKHEMYSFKETSTCEYEVMVLSPLLCSHPDYRPESANEQHINCQPSNKETATKPMDMVKTEKENHKMLTKNKMYEADFFQGNKGPGSVKIEIKPVNPFDGKVKEQAQEKSEEESMKDSSRWRETKREPSKPLSDPQIVRDFLMGDHCLYGGTGWWKYEFCYGKTVKQYHEEKGERLQLINLGHFDKTKHVQWLKDNPSKLPKKVEFRKHVSHFYGDGDFCELSGKPREIEVKLKCKPSQSLSAVTLYLLEPKTCEYILGVESPLICDILNRADEHGIMETYPSMDRDIITDDETLDELVEKAGRSDSSSNVKQTASFSPRSNQVENKVLVEENKLYSEGVHATDKKGKLSSDAVTDEPSTQEKDNFITRDELIQDINNLLKMKFNKKIKQQLDSETLKKVSTGKLLAAQSDMLSTNKNPSLDDLEKLYKNLENLRREHPEDKDFSDELESGPDFEESTEYDDLEESDDD